MSDEVGAITFQRNYDTGEVTVMGEIPKRVAVSLEFIDNAAGIRREGDDIYFDTVPPLHLRVLHSHPRIPEAVIAEVVTA